MSVFFVSVCCEESISGASVVSSGSDCITECEPSERSERSLRRRIEFRKEFRCQNHPAGIFLERTFECPGRRFRMPPNLCKPISCTSPSSTLGAHPLRLFHLAPKISTPHSPYSPICRFRVRFHRVLCNCEQPLSESLVVVL